MGYCAYLLYWQLCVQWSTVHSVSTSVVSQTLTGLYFHIIINLSTLTYILFDRDTYVSVGKVLS